MDEFEDLNGYVNLYKINRKGEIWSCHYSKILSLQVKEGYFYTDLTDKDKIRHKCYIHRLLALQYIPNPENKPEVDHKNRNRKDNDLTNLRWVDKIEQNNNKSNCLSAEQKEVRKIEITAYKTEWARQNRLKKGIEPKKVFNSEEERREADKKSKRDSMRRKRAELTDEQRAEMNRIRREKKAAKKASV